MNHRTDTPSPRTERRRRQMAEELKPVPSCVVCGVSIEGRGGTRFCRWCRDENNKEQS